MILSIGRISYLNTVPYFYRLADSGFAGRIVAGVPSELNRRLAEGELDLSPSSSFEYARQWRDYRLLPGHSISSLGPVRSVLLFSPLPLERMAGEEIALTGESSTSVNLLRVLLGEFCGAGRVACHVPAGPVEEIIAAGGSALLIGDRALSAASHPPVGCRVYDLGELWQRFTGLPFVFALWIVRESSYLTRRAEILAFRRQLDQALELAFADLAGMAAAVPAGGPLGPAELVQYWQGVSYQLTAAHLAGLQRFFALCVKHALLPEAPEIRFTD